MGNCPAGTVDHAREPVITCDHLWRRGSLSKSVVKAMTATLVGAAIHDWHIKSIDDPVTDYLPQFLGSAYDGVTVRHLLQMTSGVAWNETYTDPTSDRRRMLDAQIGQQSGDILELMSKLDRAAEPGMRWNYSTGETQVVGALVRATTGMPVAEYLSTKIWAPFGMESDANWWLESPDGLEVGGSGLVSVGTRGDAHVLCRRPAHPPTELPDMSPDCREEHGR